jgi:hypothetical protein
MLEKVEVNCLNCGAPLRRGASRCEYCGTWYKSDGGVLPAFREIPSGTKTFGCSVRIDKEALLQCHDDAMEYAKKKIAHALAKQIVDCMELETKKDYLNFSEIIQGRVTIVDRR